jgi:hypothetical protein
MLLLTIVYEMCLIGGELSSVGDPWGIQINESGKFPTDPSGLYHLSN